MKKLRVYGKTPCNRSVNMVHFEEKAHYDLQDLRQIVHLLRAPGGCPWDAAQTHASLRRQMLEEAWEVVDAIDREDAAALREELGDVLLQVVFHADLEADRGAFTLDDVADAVCRKMISRHPHVFGDGEALPWEELKRREKGQRSTAQAMEEVAHSLPGLWRAEKIQAKAAGTGFDWPDISGAMDKLDEEVQELHEAVESGEGVEEELGDVLLHVAFYAKIGSETDDFDMKDVCDRLCEKLIFRHPHVFGDVKAETAGQVSENWEQLKLKEKDGNKTVLSGVPAALPSLIKAYRIQDKARNVGFDWEEREQVWDKVKEEIQEFQAEVAHMDKEKAEAEFGDVMFSLINAARLYKINPDNALEQTNQKFINRFNYVEAHSIKEGKNLHDMTLEEMDKLWNEAKALEKESKQDDSSKGQV